MNRLALAKTLFRHCGDVLLCLFLLVLFQRWPQIDLDLSAQFWRPGVGFWMDKDPLVQLIYIVFLRGWLIGVVWLLLLLARLVRRWRPRLPVTRTLCFLLAALLLGPGLMVNVVLKDHAGRPRPYQIRQFGGDHQFLPAASPDISCGDQCNSFVSGHAAMGFYFMSFYWIKRQRRWLVVGICTGLTVGMVRIFMGGHFLSDVLFAGLVVHFVNRGLAWAMLPRTAPLPASLESL